MTIRTYEPPDCHYWTKSLVRIPWNRVLSTSNMNITCSPQSVTCNNQFELLPFILYRPVIFNYAIRCVCMLIVLKEKIKALLPVCNVSYQHFLVYSIVIYIYVVFPSLCVHYYFVISSSGTLFFCLSQA